jgi:hypothetical protein
MGLDTKSIGSQIEEVRKLIKIRNLIVHNDGKLDEEFLNKYPSDGARTGDSVKLSYKYLTDSLYLIYFIGTYILQDAQIHFSDHVRSEDFLLNNLLHTLIKNNQFVYIKSIYNFAQNNKMDDINKKLIVLNYCIGLKKQGKDSEHIKKVLELEDWSIERDDFEMCKSAIFNNHKLFYSYLEKSVTDKKISIKELDDWVIFDSYREDSKFKKIRKSVLNQQKKSNNSI